MREEIKHNFIFWSIGLLLFLCTIGIALLVNKKLLKKVGHYLGLVRLLRILKLDIISKRIYDSLNAYKNHKLKIGQGLILSAIAQFVGFSGIFFLSTSLSVYIPFGKIFLIMPIVAALCMLPITMNGLGLREWAFVFFFSPNIGDVAALSFSLLYLAMFLLSGLIGGIIYIFWR